MIDETLLFIFLIGIISAYVGGFASGGVSSLAVGLLTLIGIPPQIAGITFKLGKIGDSIGSVATFHKHGHIKKRYLIGGGLSLFAGSFLGSYLISSLSNAIIYGVCGTSMLIMTFFSFTSRVGLEHGEDISKTREILGYFSYFVLSVLGNLFPAGSGTWYYFANTFIFRMTTMESKGISSALTFFWFIGTFFGVMAGGIYNIPWALALMTGMIIGGFFSSKHIIRLGNENMRKLLLASIVLFAFYFLYLSYVSYS